MWLEGTLIHSGITWLIFYLMHKRVWGFRYAGITLVAVAGALLTSPTSATAPMSKGVSRTSKLIPLLSKLVWAIAAYLTLKGYLLQ